MGAAAHAVQTDGAQAHAAGDGDVDARRLVDARLSRLEPALHGRLGQPDLFEDRVDLLADGVGGVLHLLGRGEGLLGFVGHALELLLEAAGHGRDLVVDVARAIDAEVGCDGIDLSLGRAASEGALERGDDQKDDADRTDDAERGRLRGALPFACLPRTLKRAERAFRRARTISPTCERLAPDTLSVGEGEQHLNAVDQPPRIALALVELGQCDTEHAPPIPRPLVLVAVAQQVGLARAAELREFADARLEGRLLRSRVAHGSEGGRGAAHGVRGLCGPVDGHGSLQTRVSGLSLRPKGRCA